MSETRSQRLTNWLLSIAPTYQLVLEQKSSASSDASSRQYFRIPSNSPSHTSMIVMDAPPEKENNALFCKITDILSKTGVRVPIIFEKNLADGFLLLSDLGALNYYHTLHTQPETATIHSMYLHAIDALVQLQTADCSELAHYDANIQLTELALFPEWYIAKLHQYSLSEKEQQQLNTCFQLLAHSNAEQPTVFVHRDFHSPNLIYQTNGCGVLDYQDAVKGPITYDIASLAQDARFTWSEPQQLDFTIRYWEKARAAGLPVGDDFALFHQHYEWVALQRNLRILGVFARLHLRDQKSHYLHHIPRVLDYVKQVSSHYDVFKPLLRMLIAIETSSGTPNSLANPS